MAFRGRTRRARGSRSRTLVAKRWSGDFLLAEDTVAAAATDQNVVLAPEDYRQQASLEASSVTLTRIRGDVSVRATVIGGVAFAMVYVAHVATAGIAPNTFAGFIDGNVLWFKVLQVPTTEPVRVELDIKARRRLENEQVIFAISAAAQTVTYMFNLRCLLLGG